jgi:hypothetical protein
MNESPDSEFEAIVMPDGNVMHIRRSARLSPEAVERMYESMTDDCPWCREEREEREERARREQHRPRTRKPW